MDDEYYDIYKADTFDDWIDTGYDENGDEVVCDICGGEMRWIGGSYVCRECGQEIARSEWFNYIGAKPPSSLCITSCEENYPFCKKTCHRVKIDPNDPML